MCIILVSGMERKVWNRHPRSLHPRHSHLHLTQLLQGLVGPEQERASSAWNWPTKPRHGNEICRIGLLLVVLDYPVLALHAEVFAVTPKCACQSKGTFDKQGLREQWLHPIRKTVMKWHKLGAAQAEKAIQLSKKQQKYQCKMWSVSVISLFFSSVSSEV